MDTTADEVASGAQAAMGDGATKRQRIEHLIQRGDRLAIEQQQRQSKAQCTLRKTSSCKTPESSAAAQVFTARRSSWTPHEDEKLRKLVLQLGTRSWSEIAAHFPSRDRKRCRERFVNHLAVKSTAWTAQDDEKLLQLQQTMGSQWAKMAKQLGGRSPESVKNRCLLLARRAADTRPQSRRQAPQKWTAAEKHKLKELVTAHGAKNWLFIASQLPGRTDMQCLQQWHRTLDDTVVKGKGTWTQSEDLVLVDKVAQVGRKWTEVAAFLPGRTGNQCRERYRNHLDPSIKTTSWTAAEEAILTAAVGEHSTHWGLIAEKLPGRSENAIKNHWYSRERRRMLAEASTAAKFDRISMQPSQASDVDADLVSEGLFRRVGMTKETVASEIDELRALCDVPVLQLPQLFDNDHSELSRPDETCPVEPPKRGRRKSNLDPATKLELDRIKDRKRCSRYRQRQRDKRENLRQEVKELTAELEARQQAREASRRLSTSAWGMLAQAEREARLSSEEQQRRLLEAVEARAKYIREFQTLLQQKELEGERLAQSKRSRLEPSDAAFYDVFVQDMDSIYAQTDETMRACGLDEMSDESIDPKQLWKEDGGSGYFMYIDKHVMPFAFQQTCDTVWQAGQLPFRQEDRLDSHAVEDAENTAAFRFRVTNRLSTGRVVSALVRFITRRYQEEDRVVVVWQSLMEGEGIFTGMRAGETGWDVLTRSHDSPQSSSVLKTCICHTPMHLSTIASQDSEVKQFTGMMLGSVADDGVEIAKMFENLQLTDE